jgi:peptidyl-prolyl cis-trans isomerase SurA
MKSAFKIAAVLCALASLSLSGRAQLVDGIKAIVADSLVTRFEVEDWTAPVFEALVRQYRDKPDDLEKHLLEAERENTDTLVARRLILQEFKTFNVPESIIDSEIDHQIEEEVKSRYGDRGTLRKTLEARGLTLEKYRQRIRERMIVSWLTHKNVESEVLISPHKIESYYLAHREDEGYKMEEQVKLRMIVLNKTTEVPEPKKLAEELVVKLNQGDSFAQLAGMYSQGSQRKENGLWGWADHKQLRKELAEVAFTLKPGQHSGVVEIPGSDTCYLMLVEEKQPAHYKTLTEVRDEIEKNLQVEEKARLEKQWIAKLKKKTFVQYR